MTIDFDHSLSSALSRIEITKHHELIVHEPEILRSLHNTDDIMEKYTELKWKIIDLLNETYHTSFCLSHWLENKDDEVSYFLNEAGSNVLSYSQFKAPYKFHIWIGKKGFILGIEQKGQGFDAEKVHSQRLKENEGAAFDFFRSCQSQVFFDDKNNSKIVFMEHLV